MASQLRPHRLDVTDRYPMVAFTIRTDDPPRLAEVVVATDPELFTAKENRTSSTFYSSREHGVLSLVGGEAVYVLRPDVLVRFIRADRLYFGLATATAPTGADWRVDIVPTVGSPYISLTGLTDRALRRVRMFPVRDRAAYGTNGSPFVLGWAGDGARRDAVPASARSGAEQRPDVAQPAGPTTRLAPVPPDVPYDDGFGPLPPLQPSGDTPAVAPSPVTAAQAAFGAPWSRAFEMDPEVMGIEEPVLDDAVTPPQATALGDRPRALTAAEYPGVRVMASPAYNEGRRGQAIDRIVIHITGAPQSPHLGSWFTREDANTSAHYMVDQNGDILQFVREQDTAWHARGANRRSIGIEHVAVQQGGARYPRRDGTVSTFPYTPPTEVEYRTSAALVAHLCRKYGLTPDRTTIVGHREADLGTGHTSCPDGAWDWDLYMAMVAECYAATPVALGVGRALDVEVDPETRGIDGPASSGEMPASAAVVDALALTGNEYDRVSRIAPSLAFTAGRNGTAVDRIVVHITDAPTTSSTVGHFTRPDATSSAHYLVGQDGEVIQFVSEADTAWHARGVNRRSIGIEHVAVQKGGATYGRTPFPALAPTDIQYRESAALVAHLCQKYSLTPDRTTIVGHREAEPTTDHSPCPDGAWSWDTFLQHLAAATRSPQPAAQALALPARTRQRVTAVALDAATISVAREQRSITAPQVETVPLLRRLVIERVLDSVPALAPLVRAAAAAQAAGVSVGIGVPAGGGLLHGGGLGSGVVLAPGDVVGVYGHVEVDAGFLTAIGDSVEVTVVNGGVDAFRSLGYAAGISGGDGLSGGAAALFDAQHQFQGVSLQVGVGAAVSPLDIYTSVQRTVAGLAAPAAAALGAGDDTVEIRYRAFIPSPLIKGPNSDYDLGPIASGEDFSGDGRSFSYDQGTSRAAITATLTLDGAGRISGLTTVSRHWGESKAYDSSYTYHVAGKPEWWMDKHAGLEPLRRASLAATDDNLSISPGASSLQRSILAVTSQSNVVSIKMAGALPLVSPSPDIDADVSIYLKRGPDGGIQVMVVGDHDGFPCHELYINRRQIYTYDPVAAGNDPSNLFPPTDRAISTSWIDVPRSVSAGAHALVHGTSTRARTLDAEDWSINWNDVFVVGQPTDRSCWATAAAMIDGWRRRQSVSIDAIAQFDALSTQNGLPPASAARFAEAIGFTVHPNACYTPEGFREILEADGPVWVAAKVPGLHAIVVTGMYRKDGQYFVRVTDPWDRVVGTPGAPGPYAATHTSGSRYILTYDDFAAEFEAAGDTQFAQLLHTGGTHGHTIDRGSGTSAGYAFSRGLDAAAAPPADGAPPVDRGEAHRDFAVSLVRRAYEKNGRRYDLAHLSGFVEPSNAHAGGAGMPALPGERVVLDDWPYIEGPSGRTQAGVGIDWRYRNGAVGEIVIEPLDGQVLDGWAAAVRADIAPDVSTTARSSVKVRVTTTFSRTGEEDQVAVTDVTLSGDGRQSTLHGADGTPELAAPAWGGTDAARAPAAGQPQLVTA
ncbi:N-acetylmuramoyl-L-alanine amidase [Cellulomonas humilata]|uniref:N-acetylmuramoyl-L-alanine amidase n=1 Tax=Cellulomonas humilata TaxID=144055 RepID=A0ABU0EFQ7_9CELL|nr:N-acetylmuramoyl-L-alanine amidase [Cellulomonas humilata]MDQ0373928.1 N-acetyl-anhydromuramyl-L-alanine amidase AmpD [Cellulomonas humilata]